MNINFISEAEELEYEIMCLKRTSREVAFSQYLCSVESRLIGNSNDAKELRNEMIKNYNTYSERMNSSGISVVSFFDAVYPGMSMPVINESAEHNSEYLYNIKIDGNPVYVHNEQIVEPPVAPIFTNTGLNANIVNNGIDVNAHQNAPVINIPNSGIEINNPDNVAAAAVADSGLSIDISARNNQDLRAMSEPADIRNISGNIRQNSEVANRRENNNAEFAIGGIVLSVLGTLLILSGAIMLAVNFFDTVWQGICLYLVCGIMFGFSELVVRKKVEKLSAVLTSLALAGSFVVTLVNYFGLRIFNWPITMIVLIGISLGVGIFSYFRNSFLFSLIGYFASFLTLSLLHCADNSTEIYMIFGIMLALGILWTVFPVRKNGRAFGIVQIFTVIFMNFWYLPEYSAEESGHIHWMGSVILLAVSYIVFMIAAYINGKRYYSANNGEEYRQDVLRTIYSVMVIIANVFYVILFIIAIANADPEQRSINIAIGAGSVIISGLISAYLLFRSNSRIWKTVGCAAVFAGVTGLGLVPGKWWTLIAAFIIMAALSILVFDERFEDLKSVDLVMKIYMFAIMFYQIVADNSEYHIVRIICFIGILLAIGIASGYKLPVQIAMTGLLIGNLCTFVDTDMIPAVIVGIMCVALALYNNLKWFKSDNMLGFDIPVLVALPITTMTLYGAYFDDKYLCKTLVIIFGLAIMAQLYMKKYNTFLSGKLLPIMMYGTLCLTVISFEKIVLSVILMAVALTCVTIGFVLKQKAIRIYGLILAILVCVKIGFIDFFDSDILIKTVMFFVVGILVLVIAGVYIVIEMRMSKKNEAD